MIQFPAFMSDAVAAGNPTIFFLVYVAPDIYRTDFPRDIMVGPFNFISDSSLLGLDPPVLTSNIDRQQFKITFSDIDFSMAEQFSSNYMGRGAYVRMASLSSSKEAPTSLSQTMLVYEGIVEHFSVDIDPGMSGSSKLTLSCSNPMADLDARRPYKTTADHMSKRYPGDTSFDNVHQVSRQISLRWGRK
jgi:hypothetical protein